MKKQSSNNCSRRTFLTGIVPATCCLFSVNSLLANASESNSAKNDHKFDNLMDEKITYRELLSLRYEEFIKIIQGLSKEWGKDKVIEFLKKKGEEEGYNRGQQELKNSEDNSLASFIKYLDDPYYDNTLSFEFIERTDTVCEIKITECLWAEVFKKDKAGAEGYAYVCHSNFEHCKSFNSKIKLIRDKTLMQGHECCNHRYVLTS